MEGQALMDRECLIDFPNGALRPTVLDALLKALPFDLELIDPHGRLAWFSDNGRRIAGRRTEQLGRMASQLYPRDEADAVEAILEGLRSGARDSVETWQPADDRFVYTQYRALHDEQNRYLGCMVYTHDVAQLRALRGSKIPEEDEILSAGPTGRTSAGHGPDAESASRGGASEVGITADDRGILHFPTGDIPVKTLDILLTALPFEIGFCDHTDHFRWYTDDGKRIFLRHPTSIGRYVVDLHAPRIKGPVAALLEAFGNGIRDRFEFWITLKGKLVSITFFALHDADGNYLGCFDLTGDITHFQELQGARMLGDLRNASTR